MVVQATERFEDAPIQVIEYADFLCPDCHMLYLQLKRLEKEFEGKLNLAFQFFPLDKKCNGVVDKNPHPGACDLSYIAAHDPSKFRRIHDDIFENFGAGRKAEWRQELAEKYGVEDALTDPETKDLVHRIINTGTEYEKNSDQWAHGIRSTPTMIINNRLVIGTFPYPHLRAIFKALVESQGQVPDSPDKKIMENWVPR
jgi:protein-disulfide isomerase